MKAPEKNRPRWLIVEGDDDQWVTIELLARHGAFWGDDSRNADVDLPFVKKAGGIAQLRQIVALEIKSKKRIGMILDADLDAGKAWTNVRKCLCEIDSPPPWFSTLIPQLPDAVPSEGLFLEQGEHAIGAWVMPNNGTTGALEDFLQDLVPSADMHWSHARDSVEAAIHRGVKFKNQYRSKAEIHTWLAWQEDPGLPFGAALKRKIFGHDTVIAMNFVAWFRRIFPKP